MLEVDVLIVGGGAAGLTASLLFSQSGVSSLLVSKYAETSTLPKAHLLSMKTMEMYRELGLEDAIRTMGTPPENMRYVGWYAGIGGPTPDHGREIARLGAWGRGHQDSDWRRASAVPYANLMQAKLEPLLKARAEAMAPGTVHFNHNFVSMNEEKNGIIAKVEDRASGEIYDVRCKYLLACDGGRTVGPLLGIKMEGHLAVATNISIHFSADLSRSVRDPEVLIRTVFNPDTGTPCVLVPVGPDKWGPDSSDWVLHLMSFPGDFKQYDESETLAAMRSGLGLPDLDPKIHSINRWPLDAVVADRFRVGKTFILGDAAHRMPPSGGHGLNTAVQDAYNLCWKVAAVLKGEANETLLDSYETERRLVAQRTVASAFSNWQTARQFAAALEFSPTRSAGERWQTLRILWDGKGEDADALRAGVRAGLTGALPLYNHLNLNFGHHYESGALVRDGSEAPAAPDEVQIYIPNTRPGSSVPNAVIEDLHGSSPLGDRLGRGHFVLIVGEDGAAWCKAVREIAADRGIAIEAASIGVTVGDWLDMRQEWIRQREFSAGGAILVRPDRFIAWRSMDMVADPLTILNKVFDDILGPQAKAGRPIWQTAVSELPL